MKLFFGVNSPYSRKVRVVLTEHGIDFEPATMDLAKPPEAFTAANPNMRYPCLIDGEQVLFESNLILEYLLETYPAKSAGDPPLATSMARKDHYYDDLLTLNTIETLLDSGLNMFQFHRDGITQEQSNFLKREHQRIQSDLDWLEARIGPEGFAPGVFSIQDLNLVIALEWLDFRKPVAWRGSRPKLEALVARYEKRPSLQATQPEG